MKKVLINEKEFEIVEDYKDAYDKEEVETKCTDYFDLYDYIVGDWAYGKLRLKGFCDKDNKIYKPINDIKNYNSYLKEDCAFDCSHFLLKKVK